MRDPTAHDNQENRKHDGAKEKLVHDLILSSDMKLTATAVRHVYLGTKVDSLGPRSFCPLAHSKKK
jgi:hypothetical protein